jgi:membrane-associated phospholipid phosphatase
VIDAPQQQASVAVGARFDVRDLVPRHPWFWVRAIALSAYSITFVVRCRTAGLIADRISVAVAVGGFVVCAYVGAPWRRWAVLTGDAAVYTFMWFSYEMTRGAADGLGLPLQVELPRDIDRMMFFGRDPTVWVQQQLFHAGDVRWYDNVASATYFTHFVVPAVALAVLWATSRVQWVRFMKRLATVLFVSCAMFVLLPTAPPWLAASRQYGFTELDSSYTRHTWRGFLDMGFTAFVHDWNTNLDWANPVAAMPSLHAAFALFVPAFFLPSVHSIWAKAALLSWPALMLWALVYLGEHWVIDGLVGAAIVGASFWFWNRVEQRQRRLRAARAREAMAAQGSPR